MRRVRWSELKLKRFTSENGSRSIVTESNATARRRDLVRQDQRLVVIENSDRAGEWAALHRAAPGELKTKLMVSLPSTADHRLSERRKS